MYVVSPRAQQRMVGMIYMSTQLRRLSLTKGCPNGCEPTDVYRAHPNSTESNLLRIYMRAKNS